MTESTETTVEETPLTTEPRFSARKALKVAAITTAVVGVAVLAKRKLTGNVDGEVTATVGTNDES